MDEKGCLVVILSLFIILAWIFLGPLCVMWLWNSTLVGLFGWPVLDYWTAFGITVLCNILFGGTRTINFGGKD